MNARCSRLWEVEAARDGRLLGAELDAHRHHVSSCTVCREEAEALKSLVERCRAVDEGAIDEIAMRRMRREVLKGADVVVSGRSARSPRRGRRAVAMAIAAVGVVIVIVLSWGAVRRSASPRVEVEATAGPSAQWQRTAESDIERFRLEDGVLALRVRRDVGARRVVVEVPDGEIVDIGTVFRVEVVSSRTERVSVEEGIVRVRLHDGTDITLHSGEQWNRSAQAPRPVQLAPVAASHEGVPSPVAAEHLASSKAGHGPWGPTPTVTASASAPVSPRHIEPSSSGALAEDQAYISVLSLLRSGRVVEARAAAKSYIEQFPEGFRRKEMSRIAQGLEP